MKSRNTYSEPDLAPLRWFVATQDDATPEVRARLRDTLVAGAVVVIPANINCVILAFLGYLRSGNAIFLSFILLNLLAMGLRFLLPSRQDRRLAIDAAMLSGLLWAMATAGTTALAMLGNDLPLILIVVASAFASCAGIITYNYAAPRYAFLQLVLIEASFKIPFCARFPDFTVLLAVQWLVVSVVVLAVMRNLRKTTVTAIQAGVESRQQAINDPLTGLLNRRGLQEAAVAMLSHQRPLVLLYLDLDGFKAINDDLGHAAGDELLCQLSARLREAVPDAAVCRLGGDEFLVLASISTRTMAAHMAATLIAVVSAPYVINDRLSSVGISIGISRVGSEETDLVPATGRADRALYRAKTAGKGCYVFDDDPDLGHRGMIA
ncbi:diguanylate cyclase [Rhizobium sp. SSA_523]|uniref:GGDEF domain-containing protein n=1 Tax=Rhizobium sp. SSA_523 TaxID=2952477 RepID=UPI002090FE05|nr:GGDEF domain-containing protein [Rhizobium sp. SSA_523]MCO5730469.1 GGDEF domain-containing protein [Rhizobium sp. SSA_523]WKC25510.1 GGDEF domain-containing protein [Rhizobium sp. SSA_523]